MDEDSTIGTELDLGSDNIVLDGTQLPPAKGAQQLLSFGSMCIVATFAHLSYTAEHLFFLTTCNWRQR